MSSKTMREQETGDDGRLSVCLIARLYWPEGGGAATMLRRLVAAWSRMGHRVTVLTTQSRPELPLRENDGEVAVIRLPRYRWKLLGTAIFIRQVGEWLCRHRREYDVVCVSMLKHAAYAAVRTRRTTELPVVLRTEGGGETGDVHWQRTALFGGMVRSACIGADAVVAIHGPIRRELLEAGYPEDGIVDIPNAVPVPDMPWAQAETGERRAALGLPDEPTICYTGRFRRQKGLEDLVRAFAKLRSEKGCGRLLLVGEGPDRSRLEGIAEGLGVGGEIHFPGRVADVIPFLRAADVFVLPSYIEGMSISLLEALSLGMPCVASDIEANRGLLPAEMLPLVPVKRPDLLAAAIGDALSPERRSPQRLAAIRERVREAYGMDSVAGRYVDLFRNLIQTS